MNLNFLQFFHDESGEYSSIRGLMIAWGLGVLFVWGYSSVMSGVLQPVPESVIALVGILATSKVVQKKMEKKPDEKS